MKYTVLLLSMVGLSTNTIQPMQLAPHGQIDYTQEEENQWNSIITLASKNQLTVKDTIDFFTAYLEQNPYNYSFIHTILSDRINHATHKKTLGPNSTQVIDILKKHIQFACLTHKVQTLAKKTEKIEKKWDNTSIANKVKLADYSQQLEELAEKTKRTQALLDKVQQQLTAT